MNYVLLYKDEIIRKKCDYFEFLNLNEAIEHFKQLKMELIAESICSGNLKAQCNTPTCYTATDGENWITIQITQTLD